SPLCQFILDEFADLHSQFRNLPVLTRLQYIQGFKGCFIDQRILTLVILQSHFHIGRQFSTFFNIITITADEAAYSFETADDLQPFPEHRYFSNPHFTRFNIRIHIMGRNTRSIQFLKEETRHLKPRFPRTLNLEPNLILARIEHTILTSHIIFEIQYNLPVIILIYILGLAFINQLHMYPPHSVS